ncbi:thioredoxin domain-containing protein [Nocardia arthritidis]
MATQTLTQHNFNTVISSNRIVLVDWWANWCGPCHHFAPVFESSAQQHPEIVYGKVDTEAEPALTGMAGVDKFPTLMAFKEGLMVYSHSGYIPGDALEEIVQQVLWLDMDEVRREMAKQSGDPAPQQSAPNPAPAAAAPQRQASVAGPARYGWPGLN